MRWKQTVLAVTQLTSCFSNAFLWLHGY